MSEDHTRHDVLVRITDNPQLARAVPGLRPEVLHAVIAHYGLQDSGELLALATPEQLTAVFDLDLWTSSRAGADEQFDAARFGEWIEVLVDADPAMAADRLAALDRTLVVAGLSPHITVWDPGVFEPTNEDERTGADAVLNAGRERGVHAEIGGYLVVARRQDTWDAITQALVALDERHPAAFHLVMRDCRQLSNAGLEFDGLDDLLLDAEQVRFDLSVGREERRDRLGYKQPEQARAFLESARHPALADAPPARHPVFAAYQHAQASNEKEVRSAGPSRDVHATEPAPDAMAVGSVIELLRDAGVLADAPRALLAGATEERPAQHEALQSYLQHDSGGDDDSRRAARDQELAFLANVLMSGCSVQARSFTQREAMDAVAATCNLGLESWSPAWPPSVEHDLVAVFQVGYSVLYRDVSMSVAERLLDTLDLVESSDQDVQFGLHILRRELRKQREAGTPWRARDRLDVVATLDLPAWAALTALLDECPVMLSNVWRIGNQPRYTVDPAEFHFIAERRHVAAIHAFLQSLTELLV